MSERCARHVSSVVHASESDLNHSLFGHMGTQRFPLAVPFCTERARPNKTRVVRQVHLHFRLCSRFKQHDSGHVLIIDSGPLAMRGCLNTRLQGALFGQPVLELQKSLVIRDYSRVYLKGTLTAASHPYTNLLFAPPASLHLSHTKRVLQL